MKINRGKILRFFSGNPNAPFTYDSIRRHFGISGIERERLKGLLANLVETGFLRASGGRYSLEGERSVMAGKLSTHRDGYGFVALDDGGEDLFVPARFLRENLHGDRVEVRIVSTGREGRREGRIVRTLSRGQSMVVGRYEEGRAFAGVIPDDDRIAGAIVVAGKRSGKAKDGQMVVVEITAYPTERHPPQGRIVEVLGWPDHGDVQALAVIRKHAIPEGFPEDVILAAAAVPSVVNRDDLKGRTDLREMPTVTIDGETARDFDDAVSVRGEGGGSIRLWVSIADVSHYVSPDSPLDREAFQRGTSVYFPDRAIPMLPEELSSGICSLRPLVDRVTVTVEMLFNRVGALKEASFYPSVIRSCARMTYTGVKKILVDKDPQLIGDYGRLADDLRLMEKLATRLMARRRQRGSIDFDLPEPEIVLSLQGETLDVVRAERNIAHRIIEEFMLAANEAVAKFLEEKGIPSLYRVHEPPDPVKISDFREFIHSFGYDVRLSGDGIDPGEFQRLLDEADGKPEERMINEVLLRCMKQARYSPENLGHYGLAARCYTHFTSPIRRYPDLVVHRILKKALKGRVGAKERERLAAALPEIAIQSSRTERIAMEAEREIVNRKKIQFMEDKVGEEFDGFITGIVSYGFFVELSDYFVEGLVHVSSLPKDYYRYQERDHAFVGEKRRLVFRIGDGIRVRVANVSTEKRQVDFIPVRGADLDNSTGNYRNCDDSSSKSAFGKRKIRGNTANTKKR